MNLNNALQRVNDVARPDSITASFSDFFATHVSMNRLQLLDNFQVKPAQSKYYSEDEIFDNYVSNPNNLHQLLIVYGQSGTGKSHLIRWFNAKLENIKDENEIILFIKRSDNTLKGTIKQLLGKPEVKNIKNKDVFDRLVKASAEMPENELKSTIYLSFITLIDADDGKKYDEDKSLSEVKRKRLAEYLRSSLTQNLMCDNDGPIDRIYSKIAEHNYVDRDTIAEFKPEDFLNEDFNLEMQNSDDMTKGGKRIIMELNSADGEVAAKKYADYLNQMIPDVIQRCSGIQPGDFGEVFKEIRKELFNNGKSLTVFIEDITSFTGVDVALLDALNTEHTGENSELCRLSSIVGGTSAYIDSNFKQNHRDRVTKYIYIPSDSFDKNSLYEFFAKYLNAMSLPIEAFDNWVSNGARDDNYPIHEVVEGKNWDSYKLKNGEMISLYPFTKNAINNFYQYKLDKEKRIPRYILRMIIEPVVSEILTNKQLFPSDKFNFMNFDTKLSYAVTTLGHDSETTNRIMRFISIWGDGKPTKYTDKNVNYISGINEEIFDEFNIPKPSFGESLPPVTNEQHEIIDKPQVIADDPNLAKMNQINDQLSKWVQGEAIDISTTAGVLGTIASARRELSSYLETSINWEAEGVSYDSIQKIKSSSVQFVTLTNLRRKSPGLYELPANIESQMLISAFCQKILNKNSWNYDGAYISAYVITSWTEKHKKEIVNTIKYYDIGNKTKYNYIEPAICSELYRAILNGEYHDRTFKNLNSVLYLNPEARKTNGHVKEWNNLLDYMSQQDRDNTNKNTIRQYFNIRMGTDNATSFVVDVNRMESVLKKLRANRFIIETDDQQLNDLVTKRKAVYEYYNDIVERVKNVVDREKNQAINKLNIIETAFDDDDIDSDDILALCTGIDNLSKDLNAVQISFSNVKTDLVKKNPVKIAEAIQIARDAKDESDFLNSLLLFSNDPLGTIEPLINMLESLTIMLNGLNNKIQNKEKEMSGSGTNWEETNYSEQLQALNTLENCFGGNN